jgi:hypothetical protein
MTTLLSITARTDTPIACDMTDAPDTLPQRLAEYRRLFDHALIRRESTATSTSFWFVARPGVRDWVLDLARREAVCCPFLSYAVDQDGEEIVWTISGGLGASDMASLDEILADPELSSANSEALARSLDDRLGVPLIVPTGQ